MNTIRNIRRETFYDTCFETDGIKFTLRLDKKDQERMKQRNFGIFTFQLKVPTPLLKSLFGAKKGHEISFLTRGEHENNVHIVSVVKQNFFYTQLEFHTEIENGKIKGSTFHININRFRRKKLLKHI